MEPVRGIGLGRVELSQLLSPRSALIRVIALAVALAVAGAVVAEVDHFVLERPVATTPLRELVGVVLVRFEQLLEQPGPALWSVDQAFQHFELLLGEELPLGDVV